MARKKAWPSTARAEMKPHKAGQPAARCDSPVMLICATLLVCALLSACSFKSTGGAVPSLTFAHLPAQHIDVADILYSATEDQETISYEVRSAFPVMPRALVRQYADSHLKAAGGKGRLVIVLEESRITHRVQEAGSALEKTLWIGRRDVYDITLTLRLSAYAGEGPKNRETSLSFHRTISIPQSASLAKREYTMVRALESLMADVDRGLRRALDRTFGLIAHAPQDKP